MIHTMIKNRSKIRTIFFAMGLLFSSAIMQSAYSVGTLDTTANGGTGFGNATPGSATGYTMYSSGTIDLVINASAIQPDGKTVVAGSWDNAGTVVTYIIRYNINGTLDATFGTSGAFALPLTGMTAVVAKGVAIQTDGKIVVTGSCIRTAGAISSYFIARLTPAGVLDTTFVPATGYLVNNIGTLISPSVVTTSIDAPTAVAIDNTGRILVTGTTTITQGGATTQDIFVVRYSSVGALDTAFNSGTVVGGTNTNSVSTARGIALISMSNTVNLASNAIGLDASQRIVVVGSTSASSAIFIARFLSTGVLDTSFSGDGYNTANLFAAHGTDVGYAVGFQTVTANRIIVAGTNGTAAVLVGFEYESGNQETTGFGTTSQGYITSLFGGSSAIVRGIAVQSNDTIVVGGNSVQAGSTDFTIARFLANGSALDTSFSTDGYTTTNIAVTPNIGNSLSLQQNGSFILAGSTTASGDSLFATARYLGDIPQGAIDYTYNPAIGASPGTPGYRTYPTVASGASATKPQVVALQAMSNYNLYVVTKQTVGLTSSIAQLIGDGSTYEDASLGQAGASDMVIDSQQRALVVGANGTRGWLYRTISSTSLTASFATVVETNSSSFKRVAEQNLGRIIVMGQSSSAANGLLIAYTEAGVLATGSTAVPFGTGAAGAQTGFITMANVTFYDLLIDSSNNIYVAFVTNSNELMIAKYVANGSALDSTFGSSGIVNTGWFASDYFPHVLSFDTAGNIVVAASGGSIGISFQKYTSAGAVVTGTTTLLNSTTLLSIPILTKLQCDTNNRLIFNGYDTNNFFVGRMAAGTFTLDTTFAPYSSSPGILKTMYSTNDPSDGTTPARVSNSVTINPAGNILFGGYENIDGTNTVSLVGQVVGNTGGTIYTQVPRFPVTYGAVAGTVNLTTTAGLASGHPQSIYTIPSGTFANNTLVANSTGTDTTLAMLDASYALNTAFSTDGVITLTGLVSIKNIMLDVDGNIYVTGNSSTDVVVYKVTPTGTSATAIALPEATAVAGLTSVYSIAQQASGRILIAGYNSFAASGVILSYDPVANDVDTSFNSSGAIPGYWFTGVAHPITSVSVATTATLADKIYFAYQSDDTTVAVSMLLENGTQIAPSSIFTPISAALSPNSNTAIAMKLDVNGAIVLVVQNGAGITATRYNANGSTEGVYGVAVATIIPATAGLALKEMLTLSDATTLILAQSGGSSPFSLKLAQLTSAFALNSSFGTSGVLTAAVSPQVEFFAVDVVSGTDGIIVSGDTNATAGSATPYLTQISNSDGLTTLTKVSQGATALGAAGTLDVTFNATGSNPGFMNFNTAITSIFPTIIPGTTTVKSLLQNDNGSYYVAGDNGTNTYMVFMSDDDVQNTSFGTSGLLTIASQANLAMMLLAQDGGFYAVGGSGSSGSTDGWINYRNASTGAAISGFTPTATLDGHYAIAQQPEGRLLVAGILGDVGTLIAYDPLTGDVDTTFGDAGYYTFTGYTAINSVVADLVGNVYIIANDSSNNSTVRCLDADGTIVNWTQVVLATTSTLAANNHLTFNQVVNLVATAVNTTTGAITLKTYSLGASGGTAATALLLGPGGTATNIVAARVTSVSVDLNASPGKILITGYDVGETPEAPFIIRTTSAETGLDNTGDNAFNAGGVTPGVVKTILPSDGSGANAAWYDLMINANGKISAVGYNTISSAVVPYMIRVYGDEFIGQYDPEVIEPMPNDLNPDFGTDGVAFTSVIADLLNGGSTIIDSQNRVLIGGVTTDNIFAVARFTSAGVLDTTFSTDGVALSSAIGTLVRTNGSYIAVDSSDNVYIGGITDDFKLIVAKFLGTTGALDTAGFNAGELYSLPAGITQSAVIPELNNGGYVTIDYLGNVLVGGSTSGLRLSVARFTSAGLQDTTFDTDGVAQTSPITNLRSGGFVATDRVIVDADNSVFVGGSTTDSLLVVAKFNNVGVLDVTFSADGIAFTSVITNLAGGGGIALNSNKKPVIGGYTTAKTFVAARFTTLGALDSSGATEFGTAGIATSNAFTSLESNPNLVIDGNNNTLLGGLFTAYDGVSKEMVMARFTATGAIDTTFTSNGLATTGVISGLQTGGFIAANSTTNPFLGGFAGTKLVVAEILSGAEIIIVDPADLQGAAFSVYWYGSNPAIYEDFFSVEFYAGVIADATAQAATIAAVNTSFDAYVTAYQDQANYNLAASTTPAWDAHFDSVQAALVVAYSGSASQINAFFTNFNARRLAVRNTLLAYNS